MELLKNKILNKYFQNYKEYLTTLLLQKQIVLTITLLIHLISVSFCVCLHAIYEMLTQVQMPACNLYRSN